MPDEPEEPRSDAEPDETGTNATAPVTSNYKVLGRTTATSGAGVLGQNDAGSGVPVGVKGAVPNEPAGYGLATPDDAKVGGALELTDALTTGGAFTHRTVGNKYVVDTGRSSSTFIDAFTGGVVMGAGVNDVTDGAEGATIGGGGSESDDFTQPNQVHDDFGTVAGGIDNTAGSPADDDPTTARSATVPGGEENTADGAYSFAAGRRANASGYDGAFVWGDSSTATATAGTTDEVRFQAGGGFVVDDTTRVQITDGLPAASGDAVGISAGLLVNTSASSARYKRDVEPLDPPGGAVLDLEPRSFEYERTGEEGVGFLAEEVDGVVPGLVGYDEEGRPDSVRYDRLGVYLLPEVRRNRERIERIEGSAAPEGNKAPEPGRIDDLEAGVESLRAENERLRAENEQLRERLSALEDRVAAIADGGSSPAPADD
jgi:hypothetical protein